jgi:uncharacterized membrane protein
MDLAKDILNGLVIFLRAVTKTVTGFIIVPLGIFIDTIKPEWEESPNLIKFLTGILLIPATAFLYIAAPWWYDFDIVE